MKTITILAAATAIGLSAQAQATDTVPAYQGKLIYWPQELRDNDFTSPDSKWSMHRKAETDNIVLFWAPEFGGNISTAPDFEGHNMRVDLANLLDKLETFYHYFYNDLAWVKPGTKADKYKMMVMLDYSLEGTAFGGAYDDVIGALWIAPNRVQDSALNCIAHELGHSFQTQIWCDGEGVSWGGAGMFEMASQWMLWQVNPDWQTDENYHLRAFQDLTHKAFLHIDNIYHSPYVLEYWGQKHGREIIAELFRQGLEGEDPVITYKRLTGIGQKEFNDEMYDCAVRLINWDNPRVWDNTRQYACQGWHTELTADGGKTTVQAGLPMGSDKEPQTLPRGRWLTPTAKNAPENYGFNVISLDATPGTRVTIDFRGEPRKKGYYTPTARDAGWRYGLVAVDTSGKATYTPMQSADKGTISYDAAPDLAHLYLVVMAAPKAHTPNIDGPDNPGDPQMPYSIRIR